MYKVAFSSDENRNCQNWIASCFNKCMIVEYLGHQLTVPFIPHAHTPFPVMFEGKYGVTLRTNLRISNAACIVHMCTQYMSWCY